MASRVMAEVAIYPLREPEIGPAILEFVEDLRAQGLEVQAGPLSSLVSGESEQVFEALKSAYTRASRERQVILRVVISSRPLSPTAGDRG